MPYVIDLFCGAGGMSEGILQAGFEILFSSDISPDVELTYRNRHEQLGYIQGYNTYYLREDIRNLNGDVVKKHISELEVFSQKNIPEIDVVFGGPPCQGFSRAGLRKENDPRNLLFREYIRIISEIKPKYVVMENVEGFMETKLIDFKGLTCEYIGSNYVKELLKNELETINYVVLDPRILDASDYGVPQRRKRAVFIAYRKDQACPSYPMPTHVGNDKITVEEAISDLYSKNTKLSKYQLDSINGRTPNINGDTIPNKQLMNHEKSNHFAYITERFSLLKEGENINQLKKRIKENGVDLSHYDKLLDYMVSNSNLEKKEILAIFNGGSACDELLDLLLTKKTMRSKLNTQDVSPTMVTLPDDYISPWENRILTVREMARLQSFDDSFVFLGKRTTGGDRRKLEIPQYTQVGNAVPPLLAKSIAKEIIRIL